MSWMPEHSTDRSDGVECIQHEYFFHRVDVIHRRNMRVHFCESGHQVLSLTINEHGLAVKLDTFRWTHGFDLSIFDNPIIVFKNSFAIHRYNIDRANNNFLLA